jgi:hypothetical protein
MTVKCEEIRRFVHPYIDHEFDERERALFDEHLAECPDCRQEIQAQMVFQAALRKKLGETRMPDDVRERMAGLVQRAARERPRSRFLFPAAAAASLGLVAAGVLVYATMTGGPDRELTRMVDESIATHEASLPPEVDGNGSAISGFASKMGFTAEGSWDTAPPLKEDERTRLVGVRLARIGNHKALHYLYRHSGRDISVLRLPRAMAPPEAAGGPQLQQAKVLFNGAQNGHSVTLYETPGYTQAVVGDIPQPDLVKLIPASL